MRAGGEFAHGGAVLGVQPLARRALALPLPPRRLLGRLCVPAGAQRLDGPGDGLLDQLAVERAVGDDRRAALELDQHAGGARLVDVGLLEPDRRRPVRVAVELLVQLLGLAVGGLGLLAEPQLGDVVAADRVQVGRERRAAAAAQRLAERPARVARQLRAGDIAGGDRLDHAGAQLARHRGDRQQGVDSADRECTRVEQLLRRLGQLEDLRPRADELAAPPERRGGAVERVAVGEHLRHGARLAERREVLAQDVLGRGVAAGGVLLAQRDLDLGEAELAAGGVTVMAGDEHEPVALGPHRQGDDQSAQRDRARQRVHVRLVELAHVGADVDPRERDAARRGRGAGGVGHDDLRVVGPARCGTDPHPSARRRRATLGGVGPAAGRPRRPRPRGWRDAGAGPGRAGRPRLARAGGQAAGDRRVGLAFGQPDDLLELARDGGVEVTPRAARPGRPPRRAAACADPAPAARPARRAKRASGAGARALVQR